MYLKPWKEERIESFSHQVHKRSLYFRCLEFTYFVILIFALFVHVFVCRGGTYAGLHM